MKKLFVALSLILGFSAAQALDGTLKIQSEVKHPQTGQTITIDFGNYVFDVFRDRRELVREVYNICKNPPEKIKTFIANRRNLGDDSVSIRFKYSNEPTYKSVLSCSYIDGKFYSINSARVSDYDYKSARPLNDVVKEVVKSDSYSEEFIKFIDAARVDAKQNGVSFTTPNKSINIKFGSQTINPETGAEGIATYPSLDYEFNVYDDRRELIKKIWETCAIKLRANILNEVKNGNKSPTMSVWYQLPGGLTELVAMKCEFNSNGILQIGDYSWELREYVLGKVNAENIDSAKLDKWINAVALGDSGINKFMGGSFNHEFITLIDAANTSSKSTQKSNTKAKK